MYLRGSLPPPQAFSFAVTVSVSPAQWLSMLYFVDYKLGHTRSRLYSLPSPDTQRDVFVHGPKASAALRRAYARQPSAEVSFLRNLASQRGQWYPARNV